MDIQQIVLLLDPYNAAVGDDASATTQMYRLLLGDVLGGSAEPLPFPVLRPAIGNDPELLLRLIEDLRERYGSVFVIVPESALQRRPPIDLPAHADWMSFADQYRDVLALLQRDLPPSRGSFPTGPLSATRSDPPPKDGGFEVTSSPGRADTPRAPSSSQPASGGKVFTGVSVPPSARPGRTFVASFAAYTGAHREHVFETLRSEAPKHDARLDLDKCFWLPGARVRVDLRADGCVVSPPRQTFAWDGTWEILRFDVKLEDDFDDETLTLCFDVVVEGITIRHMRPQIEVRRSQTTQAPSTFTEEPVPGDAFASYSTKDQHDVKSRVRSLQIHTQMDIFLDRTHLVPGVHWETKLADEVRKREQFWLFWSRNARDSIWVDREWRLALRETKPIEPHPLDTTPPPAELAYLQFGTDFEAGLSGND